VVNVGDIARVFPQVARSASRSWWPRLVRKGTVGQGARQRDLEGVRVDVTANAFSGSAVEKINAAGGSTTKL